MAKASCSWEGERESLGPAARGGGGEELGSALRRGVGERGSAEGLGSALRGERREEEGLRTAPHAGRASSAWGRRGSGQVHVEGSGKGGIWSPYHSQALASDLARRQGLRGKRRSRVAEP